LTEKLAHGAFEAPLRSLKTRIAAGEPYFEHLIGRHLLDNPHRTTLTLRPDPELAEREVAAERHHGRMAASGRVGDDRRGD
jgi:Zn-dependent M16 (insulinase) family peptidase